MKFLIDTGAGVTLISEGIFQQLSQGVEGSLQEVPFDVCGGSQLEVLSKDLMEITIGPLKVLHEIIVADTEAGAILGMDFLSTHECKVDLADQHLIIHGMEVILWREGSQPQCCRITDLPQPHSVCLLEIRYPPLSYSCCRKYLVDTVTIQYLVYRFRKQPKKVSETAM